MKKISTYPNTDGAAPGYPYGKFRDKTSSFSGTTNHADIFLDLYHAIAAVIDDSVGAGNMTGTPETTTSSEFLTALKDIIQTEINNNSNGILHVQDQKTSGTSGGTFTAGDWRTRDLNAVLLNTIVGASLSANQITLPAGTFWIFASAPAREVQRHQARFYNVTDTAVECVGTPEQVADNNQSRSFIISRFTIAAAKTFELQHQCSTTDVTLGFGTAGNFNETEIYSDVRIVQEA